jgi:hypothetical protein
MIYHEIHEKCFGQQQLEQYVLAISLSSHMSLRASVASVAISLNPELRLLRLRAPRNDIKLYNLPLTKTRFVKLVDLFHPKGAKDTKAG